MNKAEKYKGFIIKCDQTSMVKEVIKDHGMLIPKDELLLKLTDSGSYGKLLSFLREVKSEGSSLGWELNLNLDSDYRSLYLAGIYEDDLYTIIGTSDVEETRTYFNDLMLMSNQQQNILREALKANSNNNNATKSDSSLNELSKINNEMANLQRIIAQKNHLLEEANNHLTLKNKELDQFAYMVSHDLKAPLRGISGLSDIILEDFSDNLNDEAMNIFNLIKERVGRMEELIAGILSYSRVGRMDTKTTTFNVKSLLNEILEQLNIPNGFDFILPSSTPEVHCSYVQLNQVLMNLMGNAVKYHDKNEGSVEVKITEELGLIKFEVIDDGPGIDEKYHSKIFSPFETANQTSRTDSTGIGLAIVQKLVNLNGGETGLISAPGAGSNFWFTWANKNEKI